MRYEPTEAAFAANQSVTAPDLARAALIAAHEVRVVEDERVCKTPGCNGDGRYAPPGRGHREGCTLISSLGRATAEDAIRQAKASPAYVAALSETIRRVTGLRVKASQAIEIADDSLAFLRADQVGGE